MGKRPAGPVELLNQEQKKKKKREKKSSLRQGRTQWPAQLLRREMKGEEKRGRWGRGRKREGRMMQEVEGMVSSSSLNMGGTHHNFHL